MSYFALNWLDWKIQWEIMRSDMPKLCRRWKAWGYHESSKKKVQSSLQIGWALYSRQAYKIQFIWLPPAPMCALLEDWPWPDQRQTKLHYIVHPLHLNTKGNETSHYSFIPPIQQNLSVYTPCVYPLLEGDIIPLAILQRNPVKDRTGTLKYNDMNNFPNWRDPSDFVTSFALWSQM